MLLWCCLTMIIFWVCFFIRSKSFWRQNIFKFFLFSSVSLCYLYFSFFLAQIVSFFSFFLFSIPFYFSCSFILVSYCNRFIYLFIYIFFHSFLSKFLKILLFILNFCFFVIFSSFIIFWSFWFGVPFLQSFFSCIHSYILLLSSLRMTMMMQVMRRDCLFSSSTGQPWRASDRRSVGPSTGPRCLAMSTNWTEIVWTSEIY